MHKVYLLLYAPVLIIAVGLIEYPSLTSLRRYCIGLQVVLHQHFELSLFFKQLL